MLSQPKRLTTAGQAMEWHANGSRKFIMIIYVPVLINLFTAGLSPVFGDGCILNFGNSSALYTSGCEGGDWGGFLKENCCAGLFEEYLYALGMLANKTGHIYLDSTEQSNCKSRIENADVHGLGCGFDKFTISDVGCSNFSVSEVGNRFASNVRNLRESCDFSNVDEEWDQTCGSCLKSWREIKVMQANSGAFTDVDSEICRFSVLISLISTRINDAIWVRKIYNCLGNQHSVKDSIAEDNAETNKPGSGLWVLIGGVIGFLVVLLLSIWILLRRKKISAVQVKKTASKHELPEESGYLKIPIKEVYSATNNLHKSNFIGEGTAGKVYKGLLFHKHEVAIKHIISDGSSETFLREVRSLSHVKHPNLVTLLGYCENKGECFLIYELCPNGNLSQWLFGEDKALSWIQRLQIALDSARGLYFLHMYPQGCIVHRDIKPTNILLGRNFEAKLSDFGLSKVIDLGETCASSEVRGTFGYVDPEYQSNHRVNSAGDVYSFGVVLLQILSGQKVLNMNMRKPMPLDKIAKSLPREGGRLEFADPRLHGEYSVEAFEFMFELAVSCTAPKQQRPSMEQVVANLVEALNISTQSKQCSPLTASDCSPTP